MPCATPTAAARHHGARSRASVAAGSSEEAIRNAPVTARAATTAVGEANKPSKKSLKLRPMTAVGRVAAASSNSRRRASSSSGGACRYGGSSPRSTAATSRR